MRRRMADDRDGWLGANRVYQNVRSTLTYTGVRGLADPCLLFSSAAHIVCTLLIFTWKLMRASAPA